MGVEAFLASLPTPDVESTSPAAELPVLEPDAVAEVVEPDTESLEISQVEAPKVTCHIWKWFLRNPGSTHQLIW